MTNHLPVSFSLHPLVLREGWRVESGFSRDIVRADLPTGMVGAVEYRREPMVNWLGDMESYATAYAKPWVASVNDRAGRRRGFIKRFASIDEAMAYAEEC